MKRVYLAGLMLAVAAPASGQGLTFADSGQVIAPGATNPLDGQAVMPATTYLRTLVPAPNGGTYEQYVQLSDFYSSLPTSGGAPTSSLVAIASRLDRFTDRFREGVALAGSINVLPPNPGDRFAVSVGGAGYDGVGAGSISVSARLREDIIAYGAVARGPSQTLVKGGFGVSFR